MYDKKWWLYFVENSAWCRRENIPFLTERVTSHCLIPGLRKGWKKWSVHRLHSHSGFDIWHYKSSPTDLGTVGEERLEGERCSVQFVAAPQRIETGLCDIMLSSVSLVVLQVKVVSEQGQANASGFHWQKLISNTLWWKVQGQFPHTVYLVSRLPGEEAWLEPVYFLSLGKESSLRGHHSKGEESVTDKNFCFLSRSHLCCKLTLTLGWRNRLWIHFTYRRGRELMYIKEQRRKHKFSSLLTAALLVT